MDLEFLVGVAFFLGTAYVLKAVVDNRVRHKLIEKDMINENTKYLFTQRPVIEPYASLKWGFVLVGIGCALLLKQIFPYSLSETGVVGLMSLFAGIGFFVYYFIAKNKLEQEE